MNSVSSSPYKFLFDANLSIVDQVDRIIDKANSNGASDIHIDPRSDDVRVRFRIDGLLHDVITLPKQTHGEFMARIKIISGLRIDERVIPQDGRFTIGDHLDVRVTIIASYYGESTVMRLLRRTSKVKTLSELGFCEEDQEKINMALQTGRGLILVTGPTGSGKTTTLYSVLSLIDNASVSTITIEDPVEYAMVHARQIQVQQKRGINFANGLRSILRQDPDVIMVGEMRDQETAAMAVSAALTGHLVLSTLHTNDAISTIVRCIEMGIEPYLVSATLSLVISQRLVRKLCPDCKAPDIFSDAENSFINKYSDYFTEKNLKFIPRGCEKCNGTGYLGRTVIAEVLPISKQLASDIANKKSLNQTHDFSKTMENQAVKKFIQGITSFEEIIKILK